MTPARTFNASVAIMAIAGAAFVSPVHGDEMKDQNAGSISELLSSGWQIAGYASNSDSRSTFILFAKTGENYLVQCLAGYDVTRSPRVFANCYRLQ